jgi:hypothetical protein
MGTKIENATETVIPSALTGSEFVALGKIGWATSKNTTLTYLQTWLQSNKIVQADSKVEVVDTGAGQVEVTIDGVLALVITGAKIEPNITNTVDLGSTTKRFKDLYSSDTAYLTVLDFVASVGVTVNEIVTVVNAASTDSQLPTAAAVHTAIGAVSAARWFSVVGTRTATNTFTSVTLLENGSPIKWVDTGVTYYGVIVNVAAGAPNTYTIMGHPMGAGAGTYEWGNPELVKLERFHVDGTFGALTIPVTATSGILYNYFNMSTQYIWDQPQARIVGMKAKCMNADSTVDPTIHLNIDKGAGYNTVFSAAINVGAAMSNTGVTAQSTPYVVDTSDILEFSIVAGGTGDASEADIIVMFVIV